MSKHANTLDKLIELKVLEKLEGLIGPNKGEPKKDDKKKLAVWQIYMICILAYPVLAPVFWALMKFSQLAMLNIANIH